MSEFIRLYPEEIEQFFVDGSDATHDAELKAIFADYKKKFNWKFRVRLGGKRKSRKNHKHDKACKHRVSRKGTKQRGGEPKNVFVPATNAKCYLPSSKKNNTKKIYRLVHKLSTP